MRNQLIPTQPEGEEAATARTGKSGNLRGAQTAHLINLIKFLLMTRLHAQVFNSTALTLARSDRVSCQG